MRYLDICAGISAPTVAWKPLGWQALAYAEIDAAPRAILSHHYPDTPLVGDFTEIRGDEYGPVDLLVGGTPCQDFSVAGLRAGLDGERGNLSLEFLRLADRARPRWVVWENVPGVLSIDGGRAFGAILGGLGELGYGFAYRVLDAQHFGVPQRRRRVFVVGHLGDWRRAAAVLFERHSLSGYPAPRRETGEGVAGCLAPGAHPGGFNGQDAYTGQLIPTAFDTTHITSPGNWSNPKPGDPCHPITATAHVPLLAHALRAEGFDASEDGTGRGTPLVPVAFGISPDCFDRDGEGAGGTAAERSGLGVDRELAYALRAKRAGGVAHASAVRRLTPRECERLQGFPDDYTLVPYRGRMMADGPRYKALGNSMAVPVVRWIGERIDAVEALTAERLAA